MISLFKIFVSSVQKELEDERLIIRNLVNTDPFLSAHCTPVLYEYEPASADKVLKGCLRSLDNCQMYLLIVGVQYGTPAVESQLNERQRKMMQWLVEGEELTSRQCEAKFNVTRPVIVGDFRKLVEMGLADKLGAGRSTRYRLKGPIESLSNRKVNSVNRKVKGKYGED